MRTDELPVAILAFIAFVVMVPAWAHYLGQFAATRPQDAFLVGLILPSTALLFITSWVKPELSGVVLGGAMLVGVVLMYPWWWQMTDIVSGALVDQPMAQLVLQLAIPALVLSFVVTFAQRRLKS